ncbi:MAG: universal stress protein [Ardenticatenaceae bacterium]|nr:universal stress protein [Anaerolineales bacterium]MCB8983466.1 universal stress protein [Ardenticatenaceae bacterium]
MKILICVSRFPFAKATLQFGGLIVGLEQSEATVLTVIENAAERPLAEATLAQAQAILNLPDTVMKIRQGSPTNEIIRETNDGQYNIVVIGDHILQGFFDRFLPSLAHRVADRTAATMLIVKEQPATLERILICTSGRKIDKTVVQMGARLGLAATAVVTLLYIADPVPAMYTGLDSMDESLADLLRSNTPLARHLNWATGHLQDEGVSHNLVMRRGVIADEIALEALAGSYDLVIIGARAGSNFWNDLLVGHVTPQIVDKAPCSVLIVRTNKPNKKKKKK